MVTTAGDPFGPWSGEGHSQEAASYRMSLQRRFAVETRRAFEQFAAAFHAAPVGLALVNHAGVVLQANAAASRLLLIPAGVDPVGQPLADVAPTESPVLANAIQTAVTADSVGTQVELHVSDEHGEHWLVASLVPLVAGAGPDDARLLVQFEEVTEQRTTERTLVEKTMRDALTGLGNRLLLFQHLDHAM